MHPWDNNTPPPPPHPPSVSYHTRLYTAELMEGLAAATQHKWLDDLSASDGATKAATCEPWSSWEGISSAGPILKNEGTREEEEGGGNGESKQASVRLT